MSDYRECDCCEKRLENGTDFQQILIARMGFPPQLGATLHICGECEEGDAKQAKLVKLVIQQTRKEVSARIQNFVRDQAIEAARMGKPGGPAAFSGKIPPFLGPDGKPLKGH